MLDYSLNSYQPQLSALSEQAEMRHTASVVFNKALGQGRKKQTLAWLTRKNRALQILAKLCGRARAEQYLGVRTIRLADIIGTENRAHEFDSEFYPLEERLEERWMSILIAQWQGRTLPPIEVLELDGKYFVRDGHHRLSVARALGQEDIEAIVIRYDWECLPCAS